MRLGAVLAAPLHLDAGGAGQVPGSTGTVVQARYRSNILKQEALKKVGAFQR